MSLGQRQGRHLTEASSHLIKQKPSLREKHNEPQGKPIEYPEIQQQFVPQLHTLHSLDLQKHNSSSECIAVVRDTSWHCWFFCFAKSLTVLCALHLSSALMFLALGFDLLLNLQICSCWCKYCLKTCWGCRMERRVGRFKVMGGLLWLEREGFDTTPLSLTMWIYICTAKLCSTNTCICQMSKEWPQKVLGASKPPPLLCWYHVGKQIERWLKWKMAVSVL